MLLTNGQIARNVEWLRENASPAVEYLTHRNLLGASGRARQVKDLWRTVEGSADAREIFDKQRDDGSWYAGGSWANRPHYMPKDGYSAFTPKYVTAVWILPILGDMGFTVDDPRVKKAYDYVLSYQWPNGLFSRFRAPQKTQLARTGEQPTNEPCTFAVFLLALSKVTDGHTDALKASYGWLLRWQRNDGGWVGQTHKEKHGWTRSCPWVSHHAVSALYHARNRKYETPLRNGLKFLVWHLGLKSDDQLRHLFYRGHNMVKELLMLSEFGIGMDARPVQIVLRWLWDMYDTKEGCFRYNGKPISQHKFREDGATPAVLKYRLYHIVEDDWLTYYMTRIAKNMARS